MDTLIFLMGLYTLSLTGIGEICGVSKQSVHKWVKNGRIADDEKVKQLANYFGIDMKYFNRELTPLEQESLRKNKIRKDFLQNVTFEKYEIKVKDEEGLFNTTYEVPSLDDQLAIERNNYEERTYDTLHTVMKSIQSNECIDEWGCDDVSRAKQVLGWLDDLADVAKVKWKDEKIVHLVLTAVRQQITGGRNPLYEDKELRLITKVIDAIEEYEQEK